MTYLWMTYGIVEWPTWMAYLWMAYLWMAYLWMANLWMAYLWMTYLWMSYLWVTYLWMTAECPQNVIALISVKLQFRWIYPQQFLFRDFSWWHRILFIQLSAICLVTTGTNITKLFCCSSISWTYKLWLTFGGTKWVCTFDFVTGKWSLLSFNSA